ncbi:MAG: Clp protease N-terminal domain-containing protein, partial [Thalassotalea sp.]|nr:Clp protease N-terminal domain-containing protein [Thalassotalea sp.]
MRLDRFTQTFQVAISDAQSIALGKDHQFIEPAHLMLALLNQNNGSTLPLLKSAGVDVFSLRSQIENIINGLAQVSGAGGDVQLSSAMGNLLNLCDKYAQKLGDKFISSEIFLLAALEDKGKLGQILKTLGASEQRIKDAITHVRGGQKVDDQNAEDVRQALNK